MKASVSGDENCVLITRHLKALASTAVFCLPCQLFFLLQFFLPKIRLCRFMLEKESIMLSGVIRETRVLCPKLCSARLN